MSALRVLVATDSFKGTMDAETASRAIAAGWCSVRPHDDVLVLPQADGGEGTIAAMAAADPAARLESAGLVAGPDGRPVEGAWLRLPDGTAVIELAQMSGITLLEQLAPAAATTRGFGEVIAAALRAGATRLVLCLGGSASNDGGAGALSALGARLLDAEGRLVEDGASSLHDIDRVELERAIEAPSRGVVVLTDVTSPLLGPEGAIAVFGPQKGVTESARPRYEAGLAHWASMLGRDPARPGMGAAGGTAFGLSALWEVEVASGAARVAALTGLSPRVPHADLVISGEGRYDGQSSAGKVVGHVAALARSHGTSLAVVAGSALERPDAPLVELATIAGGSAAAMADPVRWAREAGALLAQQASSTA